MTDNTNFGLVGDLGHIEEELQEIVNFLNSTPTNGIDWSSDNYSN